MLRFLLLVLASLLGGGSMLLNMEPRRFCVEPFSQHAEMVSPPGVDAPTDHEFDALRTRVYWSVDQTRTMFVRPLDPFTGHAVGSRVRVDVGIVRKWNVLPQYLGDGAEWAYSQRGSELAYMKAVGTTSDRELWWATETAPGVWSAAALPSARGRGVPWPSKDPQDVTPRVLYAKYPAVAQTVVPWDMALRTDPWDPASEQIISVPVVLKVGGPRWIAGHHKVVFAMLDTAGREQVAIYDCDTRAVEQVTDFDASPGSIDETWTADLGGGEFAVWFTVDERELWTMVKGSGGGWVVANVVDPGLILGGNMPYIISPEPLTWRGEPYIIFQRKGTPGPQAGQAEILLTSPFSSEACHFRAVSPSGGIFRHKPETLPLVDRVVAYYTERVRKMDSIWVAETGL